MSSSGIQAFNGYKSNYTFNPGDLQKLQHPWLDTGSKWAYFPASNSIQNCFVLCWAYRQNSNWNTVEFIKAAPSSSLGKTFVDLSHGLVVHLIWAVEHVALDSQRTSQILKRIEHGCIKQCAGFNTHIYIKRKEGSSPLLFQFFLSLLGLLEHLQGPVFALVSEWYSIDLLMEWYTNIRNSQRTHSHTWFLHRKYWPASKEYTPLDKCTILTSSGQWYPKCFYQVCPQQRSYA